jgi:hypothetical protein
MSKTKTEVQRPPMFALVDQFKWRDKFGNFHKVEDMETRHLFHVVRMVWDHSMPREWQTRFKNRYRFPEFYSEDYMALAIRLMLPALLHRRDLTPEQMYWLQFMRSCLRDHPPKIPFVLKIGYEDAVAP